MDAEDVADLKLMDEMMDELVTVVVFDSVHLNDLDPDQVYSSLNYAVESFDGC